MILQAAAQRYLDFNLGVYADPCFLGDYPESVRKAVPALPKFTKEQKKALKASVDYFALNHYTTNWVGASKSGLQSECWGSAVGPSAMPFLLETGRRCFWHSSLHQDVSLMDCQSCFEHDLL